MLGYSGLQSATLAGLATLALVGLKGLEARCQEKGSDSVLATSEGAFFGAGIADALDDEAVVFDSEAMRAGDFVSKSDDFIAGKFDQLPTLGAVQVVVFWVAVIEFVHASTVACEAV